MMKKLILAGLLLFLIIGGVVLFGLLKDPAAVTTRIVLTGTDGLRITGTYTADGKESIVEEILPAEITITAKRMSLLVKSSDESKSVTAEVFVNDKYRLTGAQRHIQITVSGKTMFSSPRAHLRAF